MLHDDIIKGLQLLKALHEVPYSCMFIEKDLLEQKLKKRLKQLIDNLDEAANDS
jgi:hypothetical protein